MWIRMPAGALFDKLSARMSLNTNHVCFVATITVLCVLVAHGQIQPPENTDAAKTPPTGVFRVGGAVSAPKEVHAPVPEYSDEARKAKLQGTCVLLVIVGRDGRPRDIRVLRTLGLGLDEKAIEAVKTWRFEPAMKDGKPVAALISVEVHFHLYPDAYSQADAHLPADAHAPEDVGSFCTKHPTGFYGAPGTASGVSCSDWARKNQSKH
jgi:TonB family protein